MVPHSLLGVFDASEMPAAKQMLNASFILHLSFFCENKHPLQISFGRQKTSTNVALS